MSRVIFDVLAVGTVFDESIVTGDGPFGCFTSDVFGCDASNAFLIDSFSSNRDSGCWATITFLSEVDVEQIGDRASIVLLSASGSTFCRLAEGPVFPSSEECLLSTTSAALFRAFAAGNKVSKICSCSKIMSSLNECSSGTVYLLEASLPFFLISDTENKTGKLSKFATVL